jgi:hypothetical protein
VQLAPLAYHEPIPERVAGALQVQEPPAHQGTRSRHIGIKSRILPLGRLPRRRLPESIRAGQEIKLQKTWWPRGPPLAISSAMLSLERFGKVVSAADGPSAPDDLDQAIPLAIAGRPRQTA